MAVPARVECASHKEAHPDRRMKAATILFAIRSVSFARPTDSRWASLIVRELNLSTNPAGLDIVRSDKQPSTRKGSAGRPDELSQRPADQQR